jgi:lipoyl-dependent peroxiredoxin
MIRSRRFDRPEHTDPNIPSATPADASCAVPNPLRGIAKEIPMKRQASAEWKGNLMQGTGTVSSTSGVLKNTPYSFRSRFADGTETNPEELIMAAHAGCFSMALSGQLAAANLTAEWIRTEAIADFEKVDAGWTVTGILLKTRARVPGATKEAFDTAAANAKAGCPVSRLLNTTITLDATLES